MAKEYSKSDLEQIITNVAPEAVNDIYTILEADDVSINETYEEIMRIIVESILKK